MRKELEKRLIALSVEIIRLFREAHYDFAVNHIGSQVIRSSTSAALNFGEAQGAESRKDFIHKIGIVLKELRETHISLIIISETEMINNQEKIDHLIDECNQLVAIFHKTALTAKSSTKTS